MLLGQLRLDTILDLALGLRALGCADQSHRLIGAESVIAGGLCPHSLQVRACGQLLGPAVLEREVAKLATFGSAAVAGTEALRRPGDLTGAPGERLAKLSGDAGDLEVPAILARAMFDRVSLAHELVGERGAVERAELPCAAEDRPRRDGHDPVVLADGASDDYMAV